ncbi:ATP-dependent DNA helicase [Aphis craccivora]|uniref:ATP-dependent DNA helicase n=1 Tax=Aphis craccivora TaxID=307492 RepID=A0A6G0Y0M6_APHCR|nr:ATP-dependent DNA helicase [Aphis craccivora]
MQINKGQTVGGKEVAKRVWIKFDEPEVGSLTRQQIKNKLKPEGVHTDDMFNWTPIEITKLEFQLGNAEHHKVTRMQLPLVEALALTMHKSHGVDEGPPCRGDPARPDNPSSAKRPFNA